MKKLITRLLIFCLAPLPLLGVMAHMVDTGLRKTEYAYYAEWNDIYQSQINADMLMLGSSRCWVHVSPAVLDTALGVNSYNLGIDGYPFGMQYAKFRIYLQHNKKPDYIVHCIDFTTFNQRPDLWQYQQFLPYLNDTIIINETRKYTGRFNVLQQYFPLYKYNNNGDLINEGLRSYFNKSTAQRTKYKGYKGNDLPWDSTFEAFEKNNPNGVEIGINDSVLKQYDEFLSYCHNNGIKVIMVFTPIYHPSLKYILDRDKIMAAFNNFAARYNTPLLNYLDDPIGHEKKYFYNSQHMNIYGAERFSSQLAGDLKPILKGLN